MKRLLAYGAASTALVVALLVVMHLLVQDDAARSAFRVSAAIAVFVQLLGFAVARAVARENVMAGWGLGVLLRFAAVFAMAFATGRLALPVGPTLMSLVAFLFVSTLIEPLFLKQ